MNWINNVVRPKIRSFLNKKETPDNLWVKCPISGEMVFYKDLEANQWVVPGSGHHMRIKGRDRLDSFFDGGIYEEFEFAKPVQDPHPPIHFGGESDAALRRVASMGQGWDGFNLTPDALTERLERLDTLLEKRGRNRDDVEISICPYMLPATPETFQGYRDAGVDRVILTALAGDADGLPAVLDSLAGFVEA